MPPTSSRPLVGWWVVCGYTGAGGVGDNGDDDNCNGHGDDDDYGDDKGVPLHQ